MIRPALSALSVLMLAGCSLTLPVTGRMTAGPEEFTGTATGRTDGSGTIALRSTQGATCGGRFVYVTSREGSGTLECSDGRAGPFEFVSTGRKGTGSGTLSGAPFVFAFGRASGPASAPAQKD